MQGVKKLPVRLEIIRRLGGRCQWPGGCNVTDPDMLEIDHVYGDGNKERNKFVDPDWKLGANSFSGLRTSAGSASGNTKYYQYMLDNLGTGRYQILCANHNSKKHAIERCCNSAQYKGVRPCPCVGSIASLAMYR